VQLIGLTGGIASGKSTIAARLAEHGAIIVDADHLAREVVEPGTRALEAIRLRFGDAVIKPDGSLNRSTLGAIIFADAPARRDLNEILHPAVWKKARQLFSAAQAADPNAIVVYDVPLLVEADLRRPIDFTLVVVAHSDSKTQKDRLVRLRGMSPSDAAKRLAAQATNAERAGVADVIIDTGGSLDNTRRQVDELWRRIASGEVPTEKPRTPRAPKPLPTLETWNLRDRCDPSPS